MHNIGGADGQDDGVCRCSRSHCFLDARFSQTEARSHEKSSACQDEIVAEKRWETARDEKREQLSFRSRQPDETKNCR